MEFKLWNLLHELQSDAYEWVDLSHSLNNDSPCWSGVPDGAVELNNTVFDWGNPILECQIQTLNFLVSSVLILISLVILSKVQIYLKKFDVKKMFFSLCIIDISEKVANDMHYAVTVEDIKAYEAKIWSDSRWCLCCSAY